MEECSSLKRQFYISKGCMKKDKIHSTASFRTISHGKSQRKVKESRGKNFRLKKVWEWLNFDGMGEDLFVLTSVSLHYSYENN